MKLPRILAALTLAAACALASPSRAAPAPPSHEPTAAEVSLAREEFQTGMEAVEGQKWEDARAAFARSYALLPRPLTLLNLAGTQAQTGHLVAASESYRQFLREARSAPASAHRADAERALARVETRLGHVELRVDGIAQDDTLTLDGEGLSTATVGLDLPIDPGKHEVLLSRAGAVAARASFDAGEGETQQVTLHPLPAPAIAAPSAAASPPPPPLALTPSMSPTPRVEQPAWLAPTPAEKPPSSGSVFKSPWFWTAAGVVVGAAVTVGVLASRTTEATAYSGNVPPSRMVLP